MKWTRDSLPAEHPLRAPLSNEAHARPPEELEAPFRLSYLALYSRPELQQAQTAHLRELCQRYDVAPPADGARHFSASFGEFRLVWERHTEFVRYTFIIPGESDVAFESTAIESVPAAWVTSLPGEILVAAHITALGDDGAVLPTRELRLRYFSDNALIGAGLSEGAMTAFTDFRIHHDGFSRWLLVDHGTTRRQCGRIVQRLLELDTYRMLAMLGLPRAQELTPELDGFDGQLATITRELSVAGEHEERDHFERLTRLQVEIESRVSGSAFRFGASRAYHALVTRRVEELREQRLKGVQTFREFVARRLAPAMDTCTAVASRQVSLLERVQRTSGVLSTRVEVLRGEQTQALLASMDRRAKTQLRLQQTVEGLSIAAITYYIVGLVGYAAAGFSSVGLQVNEDLVTGISIPVVAVLAALGLRRLHARVARGEH